MKSKLFIALLWVLVFLLGGVAGAVSYHLYRQYVRPKPGNFIKTLANDLKKDLKLDVQQTESLKAIFDEHVKRKQLLLQEYRPRFETIRNDTDEKIKGILRPDQKLLFEERLKKFKKPGIQPPPSPPAPSAGK
jgi:hypothetical protein